MRRTLDEFELDPVAMGERLRCARVAMKLSRLELADASFIAYSYLAGIEIGDKTPSLSTLARLCDILGVSMDWVVRGGEVIWNL